MPDFDQPPEFPPPPDPLAGNPPSPRPEIEALTAPIHDQPVAEIGLPPCLVATLAQADHLRRISRTDWHKLPEWPAIRDSLEIWEAAFESQLSPLRPASQAILGRIRRHLRRPVEEPIRSRAEIEAQVASGQRMLADLPIKNDSVASALEETWLRAVIWALEWVLGSGEENNPTP